jgi:glycerol-3-phosphate acyltransferase PlsY
VSAPHIVLAVLLGVGAYLLGSVPFGIVIGKGLYGIDVREQGSGNIGTANVFRVLGYKAGVLVLIADIGKGFLPAFAAARFLPPWVAMVIGALAVIGHMKSPFIGFRGGKGVATSAGVALGLMGPMFLLVGVAFILLVLATRIVSVASLTATMLFLLEVWLLHEPLVYRIAAVVLSASLFWSHRTNISRLIHGREHRFDFHGHGKSRSTARTDGSQVRP